ncbi:endo-1,4-beta-xylanase [Halogeometricum sp. S1BR25-6]|uniref:endo-1,4-beta-xylanase n=1 Tax=Halogeometricum salsisoli TaxID=2950536 RepID=A0ABU2GKI7_9EURY|nr:endo-1,4-beta-xylanase [Halogeometricum sp. S1BR25-6]MDS0300793.1 endo-1,4-beta-xylanase [Halogeometricum sp. S1BR25-6]
MSDDNANFRSGRRPFLKSMGVLGVSAAFGTAAAGAQSDDSLGAYHATLREELTASSRQQKQLPAGEYVYGTTEEEAIEAFSLVGGDESTISVDSDAIPITMGERLELPADGGSPSDYAYRGEISDRSFEEGDLLLAVAYLRSDAPDAEVAANFAYHYTDEDGADATSANFVQRGTHVEPWDRWMRYFFPIQVGAAPTADAAPALEFWTCYGEQTVDVGGIALFDYGDAEVTLDTLPPYDYEGRSLDAAWREEAADRIEETRKRDFEVRVLAPGGEPMTDATVDVEMTEHAFDFGSAVSVAHITGDDPDDERYRSTFLEDFNKATVENGLKYPAWESEEGWDIDNETTLATLEWLNDRDYPVRGHYLLWEQFTADGGGGMAMENGEFLSAEEIRAIVSEKIRNHAHEFEEEVTEWDMHNHPIWQSNFRDMEELGWDAVAEWWAAADEATDHALYTNEMGAVGGQWQRSQYLDYVEHLVENDYPLDGIGFMGHHQQQYNQMLDVGNLIDGFEAFSEFGVPLLVTEFDIQIFSRRNAQDVEVQTDYLRDFLTVAFSQPAVEGVVSWGFWEEDHWRPTGAYYDADWSIRPHGEMYRQLVFEEWWTEERGETDEEGVFAANGFKGSYEVTAQKGALSGTTVATVDEDHGAVTVELESSSDGDESEGRGDDENGEKRGHDEKKEKGDEKEDDDHDDEETDTESD